MRPMLISCYLRRKSQRLENGGKIQSFHALQTVPRARGRLTRPPSSLEEMLVPCIVLRRLIRSPASPSRAAWPAEETFTTGRDLLAWGRFQARTFGVICRRTSLTALVGSSNCPPPLSPPPGPHPRRRPSSRISRPAMPARDGITTPPVSNPCHLNPSQPGGG